MEIFWRFGWRIDVAVKIEYKYYTLIGPLDKYSNVKISLLLFCFLILFIGNNMNTIIYYIHDAITLVYLGN